MWQGGNHQNIYSSKENIIIIRGKRNLLRTASFRHHVLCSPSLGLDVRTFPRARVTESLKQEVYKC